MENKIELSTVSNSWFIGFTIAIFIILIWNIISQHTSKTYYHQIFCNI